MRLIYGVLAVPWGWVTLEQHIAVLIMIKGEMVCPSCNICFLIRGSRLYVSVASLSRWLWTYGKTLAFAEKGRENGSSRRSTNPSLSSWFVPKA